MSMRKRIGLAAISLAILATPALAGSIDFYHDKSNWQDAFTGVLAKPEAGAEVKVVPYPDTSTYQAAVRASLRTPSAPGIFTWWSGYRMKDLVDAGLVADVSPLWKKYTDAGLYNPSLASAYTFNGKIYGIPDLVAYWVVFYNKKVFDKYQLTPPKTWGTNQQLRRTARLGWKWRPRRGVAGPTTPSRRRPAVPSPCSWALRPTPNGCALRPGWRPWSAPPKGVSPPGFWARRWCYRRSASLGTSTSAT